MVRCSSFGSSSVAILLAADEQKLIFEAEKVNTKRSVTYSRKREDCVIKSLADTSTYEMRWRAESRKINVLWTIFALFGITDA